MTRKQKHLLARIAIAAILFLQEACFTFLNIWRQASSLSATLLLDGILYGKQSRTFFMDRYSMKIF